MILEDQDVAKPFVILQIEHTVAVSPQDIFDRPFRQGSQSGSVIWSFDDHLMRTDTVHLVKEAFALAVEIAFDAECGKFVGHHANGPTRRVRSSVAPAINKNLRRRLGFVTGAERTILAIRQGRDALAQKIVGALSALGGNNHPAASNRVFSQLRQCKPPRQWSKIEAREAPPAQIVPRLAALRSRSAGFFCGILHFGAESILMQADDRRLAGRIIDGHDVEPAWAFANTAFRKKVLRGAGQEMLLTRCYAQLRQGGHFFAHGARADFNEGERFAIVADHIDFALCDAGSEVARDENVAVAAEIPIGVSFAANASLAGFVFSCIGRRDFALAQAFSRSPMDGLENQSRNNRHRLSAERSRVAAV